MASPVLPRITSHRDVLDQWASRYQKDVETGRFIPFTYPMLSYGLAAILVFLLVPGWRSRTARYATFAVSTGWHAYVGAFCRSPSVSIAFAVGITMSWGILWAASLLLFNDVKASFQRVEKFELPDVQQSVPLDRDGMRTSGQGNIPRQRRKEQNGTLDGLAHQQKRELSYRWQPYPERDILQRIIWSVDLLINFRGVGWNWRIPGLPSRPPSVEQSLHGNQSQKDQPVSRAGLRRYDTRRELLLHNVRLFAQGYIIIDLLETLMHHDAYFWGILDAPPPTYFPFSMVTYSLVLTRCYRLIIAMCYTWMGLRTTFTTMPLLLVGVIEPLTGKLGTNGDAWLYPDHFGSYASVFGMGLAGWWGSSWHQVFRGGFSFASQHVIRITGITAKKQQLLVGASVAFVLSGVLHACAAQTMPGETRPLSRSFLFFAIQPAGIVAEMAWQDFLGKMGIAVPTAVSRAARFVWVHVWFYYTAPLVIDDFAAGGLLLFEPLPVSLFRSFGLGGPGDGLVTFRGWNVRLVWDKWRWWASGIAV